MIATTCGYGLDGAFEALGRLWMPWRGKTFSRQAAEGVNLFTVGGRRAIRVAFPRYRGLGDDEQARRRSGSSRASAERDPPRPHRAASRLPRRSPRTRRSRYVGCSTSSCRSTTACSSGQALMCAGVAACAGSPGSRSKSRPAQASPASVSSGDGGEPALELRPDASSTTRTRWRSAVCMCRQDRSASRASSRIAAR